ncbi:MULTISPECIES: 50S ribosomal protein L17 [Anaerococcus]|jgi:ribosomal protein L17|uniref:Large ribosomal subunit protein bL17 n=1 Tax=Anaerococcus nagyae TaxID=1755241 RepID=A0A3E2TL47_9FIRM|nr:MULTISPECIES: 50S ribosomal protein L17 [Anaerococcus]MBP2069088.1 large subunit ribosomal protein L17 [Anaerococcus nagyae]MDU1828138.1 50S ribosomal protein L17 [Anaerococcus sp.]MDU1864343.1 50S ribosomal protein L17 [Anaerococcus sp.]MDU2353251.1 50S ribosomal protein L17 [Anaerococcus sp.]MDU2565249.1 50S ribosomal protein L17 [Anaerococcus sp.]
MANKRKLGRRTDHRNTMLRNQVTSLFENGRIETTISRAKETQKMAEKMISLGKENTLHSRRQAAAYIYKPSTVQKLFDEIAPEYAERNGGYTRVLKLGPRRGDGSERAILELV